MQTADYYRSRAIRIRDMADALWKDEDRETLRQLAQDLEDIAADMENHGIEVANPSAMPQLRHDR